jgi:RNA polymerase sigma factor (sigma-70 family)
MKNNVVKLPLRPHRQVRFEDIILELKQTAGKFISLWNGRFDIDELVNEAWIRCPFKEEKVDIALILKAAKLDMLDYIRDQIGRDKHYFGGKCKSVKYKKPLLITNIDSPSDSFGFYAHKETILDKEIIDKNLEKLEIEDEILKFIGTIGSSKRRDIIINYFLNEMTLKEVGCKIGISESRVCTLMKKTLEKYRSLVTL